MDPYLKALLITAGSMAAAAVMLHIIDRQQEAETRRQRMWSGIKHRILLDRGHPYSPPPISATWLN